MTTKRMLDDAEASPLTREVLRSDREMAMPKDLKPRVWSAIAAQLPSPPPGGGSGHGGGSPSAPTTPNAPPAASAMGHASAVGELAIVANIPAVKAIVVLATLGGSLALTYVIANDGSLRAPEPAPSTMEARPAASTVTSPRSSLAIASARADATEVPRVEKGPQASVDPVRVVAPRATDAPPDPASAPVDSPPAAASIPTTIATGPAASNESAASGAVSSPTDVAGAAAPDGTPDARAEREAVRRSELEGETRALREARERLRGGDAARSLALIEAATRAFPRRMLGEEWEALSIEALARSGRRAEAAARARAFLAAHPTSAHAADMRTFASD